MPKLVDSAVGYFEVDGIPYQKGSVRVVVKDDSLGLTQHASNLPIVAPQPFGDWTDNLDAAYASFALLIADIKAFCFQI